MLSTLDSSIIVVVVVLLSLVLVFALRRVWPPERRTEHNEIIGWQVSVLGTTYAVILGFMLYAVWGNFQNAGINAENEANAVVDVFRLAAALPSADRQTLRQLTVRYTDAVIDLEWPAMGNLQTAPAVSGIVEDLWSFTLKMQPLSARDNTILQQLITELTKLTESRRVRLLESNDSLPPILWCVLILGCAVTITSNCMFGTENFRLHLAQVFSLSLLLGLLLVTVADINRPFQGAVHVDPSALLRARTVLSALSVAEKSR